MNYHMIMTTTAIIEVVNEHWSDYLPCIKTEYPLNVIQIIFYCVHRVRVMVFNVTFNIIAVTCISWQSVLLVDKNMQG